MPGAAVTIGVMVAVTAFLAVALGGFPLVGDSADMGLDAAAIEDSETLNAADVEAVGNALFLSYENLINDIASFQENPSLERAESRKNAMIDYARVLTGQFSALSDSMKGQLDELLDEAEDEAAAAEAEIEAASEEGTP